MSRTGAIRAAGLFALLLPCVATAATLKEPEPISISSTRHPLQLLGLAIEVVSSSKHGWRVDDSFGLTELPGGYRIRVIREWNNRHAIYAFVTATPHAIAITYSDSRELDFKEGNDGDRRIHGSYNEFTKLLARDINNRLPSLCNDFGFLEGPNDTDVTFSKLSTTHAVVRNPRRTENITNTGYVIREYTGFMPNGAPYNCGPIVTVFLNDVLVDAYGGTAALAKLNIQGEIISQRHASGQISYGQAAYEYKEAEINYSQVLGPDRKRQLLSYYRLLASRLSKQEISLEEFDYLVIEKEVDLKAQQDEIAHKQAFERGLVAAEYEKAGALQEQAAAMRSQARAQHQANFQRFLNGLKSVTCNTTGYGNTSTTTCR